MLSLPINDLLQYGSIIHIELMNNNIRSNKIINIINKQEINLIIIR